MLFYCNHATAIIMLHTCGQTHDYVWCDTHQEKVYLTGGYIHFSFYQLLRSWCLVSSKTQRQGQLYIITKFECYLLLLVCFWVLPLMGTIVVNVLSYIYCLLVKLSISSYMHCPFAWKFYALTSLDPFKDFNILWFCKISLNVKGIARLYWYN